MKKSNRRIFWLLGISAFFIVISVFAFIFVGDWLQIDDKPEQADAIIILSGGPLRALYAADLYKQGYAHNIYISKPIREYTIKMLDDMGIAIPYEEGISRHILIKKGVPDKNIHIFGQSSLSTIEEAETLNRIFKGRKCSLLIVTSPFHVRRSKMIFNDILKSCDLKIVGTPYEPFPKKWWTNQDSARNVILEITKILFYQAGGRFRSYQ